MSNKTQFTLKAEHLKMLANVYWEWNDCEYGAPAIDPKRPFGNSGRSGVLEGIRKAIGLDEPKRCPHCEEALLDSKDEAELEDLFREVKTALEVVFTSGSMEPGAYKRISADYSHSKWVRA